MGSPDRYYFLLHVSTHSHPKVAAYEQMPLTIGRAMFQHTATRRWLRVMPLWLQGYSAVSTHSHPKVAALLFSLIYLAITVSTHSHPKVAACLKHGGENNADVSTHSHPKVAAPYLKKQEKSAD